MNSDFRKYAVGHLGMSGNTVDSYMKAVNASTPLASLTAQAPTADYMNPYILEERQLNVTQLDVFSRLMMDRIIFLGTQVTDQSANIIQAQLLYLDSADPGKDINHIYQFSRRQRGMPVWGYTTLCSTYRRTYPQYAPAWQPRWQPYSSWQARKGNVWPCPIHAS